MQATRKQKPNKRLEMKLSILALIINSTALRISKVYKTVQD